MLLEYSVEKPLNREPCPADLVKSFITKSNIAYDRNHGPLPHINGETHKVRLDGCVNHVQDISVQELGTAFPQHEVISALQCAGNRRHTMRTEFKEVCGIDWNNGAVMNCTWRGPLLADVLARAGVKLNKGYVAFSCMQTECQDDGYYGSSICLSRCLDPSMKVILALEVLSTTLSSWKLQLTLRR
jgi:sulfite oxidase